MWLRRRLGTAIGSVGAGASLTARMFAAALAAAAAGHGVRLALAGVSSPLWLAFAVAAAFGAVYLAVAHVLRLGEARTLLGGLLRRVRPP